MATGVEVELADARPVAGVVRKVVDGLVAVGRRVDLGGAVDSGPPIPYFRGLDQRSTNRNLPAAWAETILKLFAGYKEKY